MAPRRTLLKARLATVRRDLDEVMDRLTPKMLPWAPNEGMRTVSGQLLEILGTEIQLLTLLRQDRWIDDSEAHAMLGDSGDLANLKARANEVRCTTLEALDAYSDAELDEEVEFGGGWFGSLGLPTVPRAEVFLNIADHEWYHIGQLTSYLWARGIDPYA